MSMTAQQLDEIELRLKDLYGDYDGRGFTDECYDVETLLAEVRSCHAHIKQLKKCREAAKQAGQELLVLSDHLSGRMGEYALAHMEQVARDTLETAGYPVPEGDRFYVTGTSAASLDKDAQAATDFAGRIGSAVSIIEQYGMIDGGHHKQWLLDQTLRALLGEEGYAAWVQAYNNYSDENGEEYEDWDEGINP